MSELVDLNFEFHNLLDVMGLVQGITLGILLIVLNKRKYRSTLFLGLFLLLYSLELSTWLSTNSGISEIYPVIFLLPFNFSWILFPLFFLYTQQVSVLSSNKTKYWLLYPGIASFIAQVIIFWLPFETKQAVADSVWHEIIFWVLGNYYSWYIGFWNLRLLTNHRLEVQNTYSYLTFKELKWARFFLIYLLVTSIFSHIITYILPTLVINTIIYSVMDLIAIYWLSYFGITQGNVQSVLTKNLIQVDSQKKSSNQTYSSEIVPESLIELMDKIDHHLQETQIFTNPDISIMDLSEGLKVHPKLASTAINSARKENFNTYINAFRIKKAETLLKNEDYKHLSIEGIANESGFHSKSAFYNAFKKQTGTTPTKYLAKVGADTP